MVEVEQTALLHALKAVKGSIVRNNINPILNTVHFEAKDNKIQVTTTDLTTSSRAIVEANIDYPIDVCINMQKLENIVSVLDSRYIDLTLKGANLEVKQGKSVFNLLTLDSAEYPAVDFYITTDRIDINTADFVDSIKKTVGATAGEYNSILSGVFCNFKKDNIEFAGCDGNRLAIVNKNIVTNIEGQYIIPSRTLENVIKFATEEENIHIYFTDKRVTFELGNILYSSSLVTGNYPKYSQLVPVTFKSKAIIKKADFINAIEKTTIMVDERLSSIGLVFKDNELTLLSSNKEEGNAQDTIEINYTGNMEIAFNPAYLLYALRNMNTDTITFCMNDSLNATVILGDFKYLVMPINKRN